MSDITFTATCRARGRNVSARTRLFTSSTARLSPYSSHTDSGVGSSQQNSIALSSSQVHPGRRPMRIENAGIRYGTPSKNRLVDEYIGYKFLVVASQVEHDDLKVWVEDKLRIGELTEDYITVIKRYSFQDVISCLPVTSTVFRIAEAIHRDLRTDRRNFVVMYLCFWERQTLADTFTVFEDAFPDGRFMVGEVISSTKLLKKISALGPTIRSTVSMCRLDSLQYDFTDDKLLNAFEKFVREYETPIEKRNLVQAFKKRLVCKNAAIIVPMLVDTMYNAQKWFMLCLEYALQTNTGKHRNIALVGLPGTGKSYSIDRVLRSNSNVDIITVISDVTQPHLMDLVQDYHKLIVIENIQETNLLRVSGTILGLLEHRVQYVVRRKNNRQEELNTVYSINVIVVDSDIVTILAEAPIMHQCGIIVEFSAPRIRTSELELRPLLANDTVWKRFTSTRLYARYELAPGKVQDLFPDI